MIKVDPIKPKKTVRKNLTIIQSLFVIIIFIIRLSQSKKVAKPVHLVPMIRSKTSYEDLTDMSNSKSDLIYVG